ncbi:MAG: hypothetical protein IPL72_17560 [Sulfuritalea sp.]|nr:hypothetical protein [Sulfuritalea sp.]
MNAATDGITTLDLPTRMNWTLATADANDPSFLLTNLDIIAALELQVTGSAAVDIGGGALVATVSGVELNLATMTVTDGVTTLTGADVLSFTGTAALFAGTGGSLNGAHTVVNNGTIGFAVSGVTLSLVMAKGALGDGANAGDTYVGVSVALTDAELIGVSGLELYASGTLKVNAATDGITTLDLPTRMNWTLATADANDPSFLLTNLDIIAALELQVTGSAAVDIGNGALVATVSGVELNLATMTVTDGVTTLTGADVLSFTGTAALFAGTGGSLNGAHTVVNNGTIGFAVSGVTLSLVMAKGALGDGANAGDTYVGVSVALTDAELIGVSGLELYASGTLKVNAATDGITTLDLPTRMNWTLATADANDPSFLLTNLDIIAALELQVTGSAAVDIGNGALVATVSGVELNLATMTVTDGVTTLTGADVLSFTGTAALFAGTGGSLNGAHTVVNNGTIGFAVSGVTLSLVMAKGALGDGANAGDTYVGVSVALTDAELIGVSGLELYASGTLKVNAATDGITTLDLPTRMNWTLATADANDPSFLLTNLDIIAALELQVTGSAAVDIGNGALVATVSGVELNLATMTVTDGVTTLTGADVLSFTGTAALFAGTGGSLNGAHTVVNNGTIGFAVSGVTLSLVMAKGALGDGANAGDTYVGVSVALTDAELIGVSGLELYASGTLKVNAATDGITTLDLPTRMNWTLATADANDPSFLLTNLDIIAALELQVTGSAAVDIGNGALVATVSGVELNLATMTVTDGVTTLTGADVLSFTGTAALFAGTGGSLNGAHTVVNNGTIGFGVSGVTLSLVMAKGALGDGANAGDTYVGVSVALTDAELIGVSGLELYASGTLKVNAATDGITTLDLPTRMNWTLATADANDPSFLLTNLDIIAALELQVTGSAAVDIGNGALVATVSGVELNLATMTVTDGVTTLTGADVLSFTGTAALFAGTGGSLNGAHTVVNNGTIGFAVSGVTLSLVMAKGALGDGANAGDTYVGVSVALTDAELIGVSGLELYASGTLKVNAATDGITTLDLPTRMNWTLATADANDPSFLLTNLDIIAALELQVTGSAAVDIGNGALVATVSGVELNLATMTVTDGVTTLTGADVLSFTGTAALFAGTGGSLNGAHTVVNNGTIGFAVSGVTLSLVMAKGALGDGANAGDTYVGVSVALTDAELIGVSGLELYASGTLKGTPPPTASPRWTCRRG